MDYMLELFEEGKRQFKDDSILGPCINSGWAKLEKYYSKTSDSPAYAAAIVLNPEYKWEYMNTTWEASWIPATREAVEELWRSKYQPKGPPSTTPELTPSLGTTTNQFSQWRIGRQARK